MKGLSIYLMEDMTAEEIEEATEFANALAEAKMVKVAEIRKKSSRKDHAPTDFTSLLCKFANGSFWSQMPSLTRTDEGHDHDASEVGPVVKSSDAKNNPLIYYFGNLQTRMWLHAWGNTRK